MSEYTPDDFTESSPERANEKLPAADEIPSQVQQEGTSEETSSAEQPSTAEAASAPENALPPEAQGEANGGPLGCCLGTMIGLLLSLSLAIFSRVYATTLIGALQGNYWLLGLIVRILMGILAFALAIFFGYVGWRLGKRFYREYDPPARKRRSRAKKLHQKA